MFIVKTTYFSHTTGKHTYTSKPFPTVEAAIAHADTVMQHAASNPDINAETCLPTVYEQVAVSEFDIRNRFVCSANQRRHDFLQSIPHTGFTNTVSFE